jgi:DNA-3-methyladenine glycosylase
LGKRGVPGRLIPRGFFEDSPDRVAPKLLGKLLVATDPKTRRPLAGRIVEVEAYMGPHNDPPDPAAHAHRGPTPRNVVLFGPAGHAYVYSIYGQYYCMNISCEKKGLAGCLLLRARAGAGGRHCADGAKSSAGRGCSSADDLLRAEPAVSRTGLNAAATQRSGCHQFGVTAAGARRRISRA